MLDYNNTAFVNDSGISVETLELSVQDVQGAQGMFFRFAI